MSHVILQYKEKKSFLMASGAPREGFLGAVRIFTLIDTGNSKSVKALSFVIRGTSYGSYFGYSIAACDVNNDASNDLIIGAPFYSTKQTPNIGAIYVYRAKDRVVIILANFNINKIFLFFLPVKNVTNIFRLMKSKCLLLCHLSKYIFNLI